MQDHRSALAPSLSLITRVSSGVQTIKTDAEVARVDAVTFVDEFKQLYNTQSECGMAHVYALAK